MAAGPGDPSLGPVVILCRNSEPELQAVSAVALSPAGHRGTPERVGWLDDDQIVTAGVESTRSAVVDWLDHADTPVLVAHGLADVGTSVHDPPGKG